MPLKSKSKLIYLLVSIILGLSFILLSFLVSKELFRNIDFDTTVRIQDNITRRLDLPFSLFSLLGSLEFMAIALFAIFLAFLFAKRRFFLGVSFFFVLLFIELLGKLFIFHPGPPHMFFRYSLGFSFPSSYIHTNYSYPSGHMARTAFLAVLLFFLIHILISNRFARIIVYIGIISIVVVMFISRIYLGEHWMTDVVGGMLLGSSLAILAIFTW